MPEEKHAGPAPQQVYGGSVTFAPAKVTPKEATEEYIGGILNGESIPSDAKGELLSVMGFSDGKGGYVSAKGKPDVITKDSIKQISIDMPPGADGTTQTRYFRQIDHLDGTDTKSGLKATAWEEIDKGGKPVWVDKEGNPTTEGQGKQEIRVSFTGFLDVKQDTGALLKGIAGDLNPQTLDAIAFTDRVTKAKAAEIGAENMDMIYSSHSFGSVDARAARALSDMKGIASTNATLMLESGDIGDKQMHLLHNAMNDPNSAFYKKMQEIAGPIVASTEKMHKESELLDGNNIRFNAILQDKDGKWHGSHVANAQPGEGYFGLTMTSLPTGGASLLTDIAKNNDHVLSGDLNTTRDRVVDQKVYPVPGYVTTSALGKIDPAHQEVPMVASAAKLENYVKPVFTPDGSDWESQKTLAAVASASMGAAAIDAMGGDGNRYIKSALDSKDGHYIESIKDFWGAVTSIGSHPNEPKEASSAAKFHVSDSGHDGSSPATPKIAAGPGKAAPSKT